jgi:N-acetylglutamate synthase-like GNAT family acetyltransferase
MRWLSSSQLQALAKDAGFPEGDEIGPIRRDDVPALAALVRQWYPDIAVGMESPHLDPSFYDEQVQLAEVEEDRDIGGIVGRRDGRIVALFTFQKSVAARTMNGRLGAVAPDQRNTGLAKAMMQLMEAMCRAMGVELMLASATLHHPFSQRFLESSGMQLVGVLPAYDRDMIAPGVVKRVWEALYAKILVDPSEVLAPDVDQMSSKVRRLFEVLTRQGQ